MAKILENEVTEQDLEQWYEMAAELKVLRAKEILLRKRIFASFFPTPSEGTNNYELAEDFVLKGKYPLERKIDEGAFDALQEKFRENEIPTDDLVSYTPKLSLRDYRKLNDDNRLLFDQCLIIKPGSPALEITKPKGK